MVRVLLMKWLKESEIVKNLFPRTETEEIGIVFICVREREREG